jgi:DNA polymerase-4
VETLHVIHVDMDAFFAAVEQRDNPALRGLPVVVGGDPEGRVVVSTASYEARRYGIHSAMPARQAKTLCPDAVFLRPDMDKYSRVSRRIFQIFRKYALCVEPVSIDEAFLEAGKADAVAMGRRVKAEIQRVTGLTASVGVSYNKFLAKMASDMEKPDGFTVITPERAKEILPGLPVRKLWGVGERTQEELNHLGIYTVADLLAYDREILCDRLGKWGAALLELARGHDPAPVQEPERRKSLGEETTFSEDTQDRGVLVNYLKEVAASLGRQLNREGIKARTVTLKIKYANFTSITRSTTLPEPTASALCLYQEAETMLDTRVSLANPVRLIGLSVSGLIYRDDPVQLTIEDFLRERKMSGLTRKEVKHYKKGRNP